MTDTPTPTPAPAPTPAPTPWYEGKLDADLLGHIENKGWKKDDPIDVAINATKQARELQRHFGVPAEQILKLPKDTADEAGWSAVRQRLGMPKEAKEYDFVGIKHADGRDLDTGLADALRTALHKVGTPKDGAPEIARSVVKRLDDIDSAKATERTAKNAAERTALQGEWGTNFEFNRLTAMQGAKRATGTDELAGKLVDAMQDAIGYKATMEFWRKIGAGTTEDTFIERNNGSAPTTRSGAQSRLNDLQSDKAWVNKLLAGDAATKREFDGLMLQIHGDKAA